MNPQLFCDPPHIHAPQQFMPAPLSPTVHHSALSQAASVRDLLATCCSALHASGSLLVTRRSDGWQIENSHLLSRTTGSLIISVLTGHLDISEATSMSQVQIGMMAALCISTNIFHQWTQAGPLSDSRMLVLFPNSVEVTPRMIAMIEGFAISLGVFTRLLAHEVHNSMLTVESCAICDRLKRDAARWQRWDEFMTGRLRMSLTHTICPTCVSQHYPDVVEKGLESEASV